MVDWCSEDCFNWNECDRHSGRCVMVRSVRKVSQKPLTGLPNPVLIVVNSFVPYW